MYKLIGINFITAAIFFIICCVTASAQFNTLRPKENTIEAEKAVAESPDREQGAAGMQSADSNPLLDENKRMVLEGMRKRQYISLPVDELKINSTYGYRNDPFTGKRKFHKGVDLDADFNYVYSVLPGRVIKSGKNRELGEFIQIEHGEFRTTYGHLMQRLVEAKATVEAGQPIGISGSSGRSTGEHLHFAITFNGKSIDPMPILDYFLQVTKEARNELDRVINNEVQKHN